MTSDTEQRYVLTCPLCSGVTLKKCETHRVGDTLYELFECGDCAIQFWWPMKNPGAKWYMHDERYSSRNQDPLLSPVNTHRAFLKERIPRGTLLDIGCGTGNFLAAARNEGYKVSGIDFDEDAIEVADRVFGLGKETSVAAIKDVRSLGKTFDVITFFEVLEHTDTPAAFIEDVKTILTPHGFIALSVPYRKSWNVFKKGDKPPRHLTRWDKKSMRNFLSSHGFEVLHIKPMLLSFDFLITKFHFWTSGFLSFGLVNRLRKTLMRGDTVAVLKNQKEKSELKKKEEEVRTSKLIAILKILAKVKDYVLFSIPAALLYLYLSITGRQYFGMYVFAKRKGMEGFAN